ncbi:MAG TPA: NAD(P)-dependent oxidoreductase [Gammaproteobacteria bacterium]|nr:NAD(P)-dependent oxidoreductase [Gammaproteobacteria bacterium]
MIIVDSALKAREAEGRPIRVGLIGAGFMGRGLANQIVNSVPGMSLCAISNRTLSNAQRAFADADVKDVRTVTRPSDLESAIERGRAVVCEDPDLLCGAGNLDALVDATGAVEFGARVALKAIESGKHLISMNAELDGTVGPILQQYARRQGVIFTGCDGDQPGVQLNLFRFVKGMGLTPLVCGNIKGLHDVHRNPTTQRGFAERWGQNVHMVTSFADGTKISFEQAIVANATGMTVTQRGMKGRDFEGHVDELTTFYDVEELVEIGGVVDYVVKTRPPGGVFVLAAHDDPKQRHYLDLYKRGEGPLYAFYTPYHLCHFEVPASIARAVLFSDPVIVALDGPRVDVVATAKVDLTVGDEIDCLGGYKTYGVAEKYEISRKENLLPMGLAEGCKLARAVERDRVLTYDDVIVPQDRVCDRLRSEQDERFAISR